MNKENEVRLVEDVEKLIIEGLKKGYRQNLFFTQNYTGFQSRIIEYLITVNIAQSLEEYCFKGCLGVNLEYPLEKFYNGSFPCIKYNYPDIPPNTNKEGKKLLNYFGATLQNRKDHNPSQNKSKRLDIAITGDPIHTDGYLTNERRSLVGIEIKTLNPSKASVIKDITRLADALNLEDEISENQILCGFVCFFRRFDKENETFSQHQINNSKKSEKNKWIKNLNDLTEIYPKLNFNIIPEVLEESPVENVGPFEEKPELENYEDYADNSGLVIGYLIKITHK
ncbi:hypothetical protein [Tenacibaculum xiamenense]|uniref:hypothetical protein n=1 Tax=Tenacibaculum xiamenense TaxID=1261553 RepID=UPI0038936ABD